VDGLEGAKEVIAACREQGIPKVGLALNPDTPLEPWEPLLGELDMVLVMSVFPGFGGQSFMAEVLDKTRRLRRIGFQGHVQMDGGLNAETLPLCAEAGADVLVSGSAIFGAPDVKQRIDEFRQLAEAAVAANPS
jgi:ribulose-phosphate 3-epimerase